MAVGCCCYQNPAHYAGVVTIYFIWKIAVVTYAFSQIAQVIFIIETD